jgi:putative transposase
MEKIQYLIGNEFICRGQKVKIHKKLGLESLQVKIISSGKIESANVYELQLPEIENQVEPKQFKDDFLTIGEKQWDKAKAKFEIIEPLLSQRGDSTIVNMRAREMNVSKTSIYRWISLYENGGTIASLVESSNRGGGGKLRLSKEIELIIKCSVEDEYLTKQKKRIAPIIFDVESKCFNAGLKAPAKSTVWRYIKNISEEEKVKYRLGRRAVKEQFDPIKGNFPDATYPLAVVQIDHTPVDVILVDEIYGKVVGRPHITVAMDVYSRMILGFYVSFDPAGTIGTALCLSHAILDKDLWLSKREVKGKWPCWGIMRTLHLDNAREFKSKALKKGCEKYGISIDYRPVATPNFGGSIESVIKTFMLKSHELPGTTFSNSQEKGDYDSEKNAALTLVNLEKWFGTYITDVYHNQLHSSLGMSPLQKYELGMRGNEFETGIGLPDRLIDHNQLRLDFMPFEERSVQQYGVVINHIHYYHDVLRSYINNIDSSSGKARTKEKFIFKYDPRDISCLYFLDPKTKVYHRVPYRNTSLPAISIWEYRVVLCHLKKNGKIKIDEEAIFRGYEEMKKIELEAIETKKKLTKNINRMLGSSKTLTIFQNGDKIENKILPTTSLPNDKGGSNIEEVLEEFEIISPFTFDDE